MFNGIIEATGEVLQGGNGKLSVRRPGMFRDIKRGSSISVAGVCLTVTEIKGRKGRDGSMAFDVVPETLRKTKLGQLRKGDYVNLERAMKSSARLDGHIVQGHVEGVGIIVNMGQGTGDRGQRKKKLSHVPYPVSHVHFRTLAIQLPGDLVQNVVSKGSIAIDGVSLTVASKKKNTVTVALVPYTIQNTTLGKLQKGDVVNVETDFLTRSNKGKKSNKGNKGAIKIGIVHSSWHAKEVKALVASTVKALKEKGVLAKNISLHEVAGAFEIPLIGGELARTQSCDALIGICIIVEGETHHASLLASSVAQGIMRVQVEHSIPFAFEVLYVDSISVARRRLLKGKEAAAAVLHSLAKLRGMRSEHLV